MHRFATIVAVLFVPLCVVNAANVGQKPVEDSTDTDVFDPSASDEAFDPQRDYTDFKSSYEKFYKIAEPSFMLPSAQQKSGMPIEAIDEEVIGDADDATNSSDIVSDISDVPTTIAPPIEDAGNKIFAENSAMNDALKSTQGPNILASLEPALYGEILMNKQGLPFDGDTKREEEVVNEADNVAAVEQQVAFVPNKANVHNESADYVNDEAIEANYSDPITSTSPVETTITSLPSSPVFITTRPPPNLFSTSTLTSVMPPSGQTTSAIVPSQSIGKKSKKIEVLPPVYKYSADEIVRKYLDDTFLRAPLATLINTAPEPLRKAKILWKSALRPNTPIDIVLVAFNSSGIGVTYSFKNTRTMIAGLDSVQESREMNEGDMKEGGSGFYGILRASELVPYDSAIFISTDQIPQDISLMKNAATILLKKRIRLYLIWFGGQDVEENETSTGGALGEVALRSGGEILRVNEESLGNGDMGLVTHFSQSDIQGAQVLEIPVNTTDSNLYIKIQGSVDQATLTTPIGGNVDLLSADSVASFSDGSHAVRMPADQSNRPEIIINLRLSSAPIGVYSLHILPHSEAQTKVMVTTELQRRLQMNGFDATYDNVMMDDDLVPRRRRSEQLSEDIPDNEVVFPEPNVQFYEQTITSNDTEIMLRNEKTALLSTTKIDLGAQSQLLASPGSTIQIHYEITNLRDVPSYHVFQVVDEQHFLRTLNPTSTYVLPGQTQNAVVSCYIPPNARIGTTDKITFSSQGMNMASQSAQLSVISPQSIGMDRRSPLMYWKYGSRCYGRTDAGRCAGSIWSLDITTIDQDTGILRVQSNPKGLLIRDRYTAGTTQEVKATYTASCCTPRVTITSYDLAGNQKSITFDVNEYYLEPMEIVAIVLGVILILIIIVAIIWAIVHFCKKRRAASRDLPVYRSRSERERST